MSLKFILPFMIAVNGRGSNASVIAVLLILAVMAGVLYLFWQQQVALAPSPETETEAEKITEEAENGTVGITPNSGTTEESTDEVTIEGAVPKTVSADSENDTKTSDDLKTR